MRSTKKTLWFRGVHLLRSHIKFLTRLRTSHICTGDHFIYMEWNIPQGCNCGTELKDLTHLLDQCPLLVQGQPVLLRYPTVESVSELERFFFGGGGGHITLFYDFDISIVLLGRPMRIQSKTEGSCLNYLRNSVK